MEVAVFVTTGANNVVHSAITCTVPGEDGAWNVTAIVSAPSIVPYGHGPAGGVLPDQLHCAPPGSSWIVHNTWGTQPLHRPFTVAVIVVWPPTEIVALGGETTTLTLAGL